MDVWFNTLKAACTKRTKKTSSDRKGKKWMACVPAGKGKKKKYKKDPKSTNEDDGGGAGYDFEKAIENKEDIITLITALQHQNFVLGNSITNLVNKWPPPPPVPATTNEVLPMFGILLETKD